ncbi:hypothetical protein BH10PSE18_BH10PSE18_04130 [soil metagenome]
MRMTMPQPKKTALYLAELRIAQSVAVVRQLPMVVFGNGFGALIGAMAVSESHSWLGALPMVIVMWALLIPVISGWLRLRRRPRPDRVSSTRIHRLVAYSGLIGLTWAACMLYYLPRVSFDILAFLITGCAFLAAGAAAALYVIPWASAAYATPMFVAALYVTVNFPHASQLQLSLLILLMACGVGWITLANWRSFQVITAITAERAELLANAEAAIVARNQFLENVSHELRTPLTGVMGYAAYLDQGMSELPPDKREAVSYLARASRMLLMRIDNLLDVTKLRAGQLDIQEDAFDVPWLLERCSSVMGDSAAKKGLHFSVWDAPGLPRRLVGDAEKLLQFMLNLVGNAIKFTDHGAVSVNVSATPSADGKTVSFCIDVTDTGIGITREHQVRVFDRFYQADGSVARRFGGAGLGLTISRALAEIMGGSLGVTSDGQSGSTFSLEVPLRVVEEPARTAAAAAAAFGSQRRVLVGDDDFHIREFLGQLLASRGCVVTQVECGAQAIVECQAKHFDLVLMDIQMPGMTGLETARHIRDTAGFNARTPMIAVTGYLSKDRVAELRDAGFDAHFGKPIAAELLFAKVEEWLARPRADFADEAGAPA